MHFDRLRLIGFKSFVDPAELVIGPGLTGIVGPNGCGKSNLLEALRWVMGESSYKSMRASGMDDVIFSGSAGRPSRNTAEVTLVLDNSSRTAPAAFNDADVLEVSRRIEREAGSVYRINGKEARARDVQLLFADVSTGARSPSLVRQGQISELISAKPQARRRILEEAAGIAGLHARRHEAELRLRAAETNLTRLDDVIGAMETQFSGLKRQARQAKRYKALSGEIRSAEATQLYLLWRDAARAVEHAEAEYTETRRAIGERTEMAAAASRAQAEIAARLPALRDDEARAAAALQRLIVERENLDREAARTKTRRNELATQLAQIDADLAREGELIGETESFAARLDEETAALSADAEDHAGKIADGESRLASANEARSAAESAHERAAQAAARVDAERGELERAARAQSERIQQLQSERQTLNDELELLAGQGSGDDKTVMLSAAVTSATGALATAEADMVSAEQALAAARKQREQFRETFQDHERAAQKLQTEIETLRKVLQVADGDLWPPLIDALKVRPGYEAALGAALGDDLDASSDTGAPVHWDALAPFDNPQPLPRGADPLSKYVAAPAALARRLEQIGMVAQQDGRRIQSELMPGQRLVTRDGALWRWDGYTAEADAPTPAAQRLAQRNRLVSLEKEAAAAAGQAAASRGALDIAEADVASASTADTECREGWRTLNHALGSARDKLSAYERSASEAISRSAALTEALSRLGQDLEASNADLTASRSALAHAQQPHALKDEVETLRAEVAECRQAAAGEQANMQSLARDAQTRKARLAAIGEERRTWSGRKQRAGEQIERLNARKNETARERSALDAVPDALEARRGQLLDTLGTAEQVRKDAADTLAEAENGLSEADHAAKQTTAALGEARESGARIEAQLEAARERQREFGGQIAEMLDCSPDRALAAIGLAADAELPNSEEADRKLERLRAERERLGGVNLNAEHELEELSEQLTGMTTERDDLVAAIGRLRQGISGLNREGRKRLLDAFEKVNANFERLFTTLFGGGKAKLELTEVDDPLEAGLEIMARPPGKRLQLISLLSGGEKALTAIALVFAVFLTNPSPICVLDEVDAPLDDSNLHRFCELLDEMTRSTETRFMIITHHPYTMSRMNRLFGVTMAERGISQLVSVDLDQAAEYRESA